MLIEKIMNRFDRTALQWRGMGPLKYLPFLVCYVLVPVTIYILQSAGTTYHLLDTMWNQIGADLSDHGGVVDGTLCRACHGAGGRAVRLI